MERVQHVICLGNIMLGDEKFDILAFLAILTLVSVWWHPLFEAGVEIELAAPFLHISDWTSFCAFY